MNPMKLFDLSGRVAVVTGGNGGIGRSLALGCASAGASVAIVGRNEEKNQNVLGELQEIGNPAMALRIDLSQRDQLEPALDEIERQLSAVFLFSKFAARSMTKRKTGKIINIGSMYSYFGSAVAPSYSAAKGAIVQLTKSCCGRRQAVGANLTNSSVQRYFWPLGHPIL